MNKRQKKKFAKKRINEWVNYCVGTESKKHRKFSYPKIYDEGFLIETDKTGNYVEKMYKLKNVCIGVNP